jgi:6,7-dimethyl-8-ribityllumazine synthase
MPGTVTTHEASFEALGTPRVLVVTSRYNGWITDALERGSVEAAERLCPGASVEVVPAPGALELPQLIEAGLATGRFDAAVALGCVIKGETVHDRLIGAAIIESLVEIAVRRDTPVGIGVLTVEDASQAESRAGGAHGNKGAEAAEAALASLAASVAIRSEGGAS